MQVERVTITQVAAEAGVSAMTVSNVLNGKPGASDATRERVLEIAERLGYQTNATARRLRSGQTGTIGIMSLDLASEYSHEIIGGIAEEFADDERELLIHVSVGALHEREHAQFLSSGIADGLLLIAPQLEAETVTLLQKLRVPSVVVDPRQLDVDLPRVTVDNYTGVRTATEHLISLGHSRIAFIRGEEDMDSSQVRFRGFTDAMHLAGLSVDDEMTPVCSFNYNAGLRTASVLLAEHDPTAIMAGADLIALGAIDAARARGLSVPEDLSVIGFDDIPRAAQSFPPLTTVRQPLHEMGLAAARVLLSLVNGHPLIVEDTRLPTTFVPRMTTTGPRSEAGADAR